MISSADVPNPVGRLSGPVLVACAMALAACMVPNAAYDPSEVHPLQDAAVPDTSALIRNDGDVTGMDDTNPMPEDTGMPMFDVMPAVDARDGGGDSLVAIPGCPTDPTLRLCL